MSFATASSNTFSQNSITSASGCSSIGTTISRIAVVGNLVAFTFLPSIFLSSPAIFGCLNSIKLPSANIAVPVATSIAESTVCSGSVAISRESVKPIGAMFTSLTMSSVMYRPISVANHSLDACMPLAGHPWIGIHTGRAFTLFPSEPVLRFSAIFHLISFCTTAPSAFIFSSACSALPSDFKNSSTADPSLGTQITSVSL